MLGIERNNERGQRQREGKRERERERKREREDHLVNGAIIFRPLIGNFAEAVSRINPFG